MPYWSNIYPEDFERTFCVRNKTDPRLFVGAAIVYQREYAFDLATEIRSTFRIPCRCVEIARTATRDQCWVLFLPAEPDALASRAIQDRDRQAVDLARRWLRTMPKKVKNYRGQLPQPSGG